MKTRTFKRLAVASAIALCFGAGTAQAAAGAGQGGNITNTRHNLGIGGVGVSYNATTGSRVTGTNTNMGDIFTTGTDQICVFCHTPHGAVAAPPAPLWNKAFKTTGYTAYTMGGNMATNGEKGAVAGMSLACLSCHDGTQAMDNMVNAPGSGGWNAPGSRATVGNDGVTLYTWANGNSTLSGTNTSAIPGSDICLNDMNCNTGALKALPQMLGTDLSNDHPIGMVYGGGLTAAGVTTNPEFRNAKSVSYGGGTNNKFMVDDTGSPDGKGGTVTASSTTWGDNVNFKLYPGATPGLAGATVECGTCHDPHIDQNPLFLRKNNKGSAVCLSCHIK